MNIYRSAEGERAVLEGYRALLRDWPVPKTELKFPTREGETFVLACGPESAPPLLLLHGSTANSGIWFLDIAVFAAHFRVYAVDMIGEPGFSAPSRPPLESEAYAGWLDDVLRGLGLEKTAIAGESLGGWLALNYATRHPERVTALALCVPGGVGRQTLGILKLLPYLLLGKWGKERFKEKILGRPPANPGPAAKRVIDFVSLMINSFRPRMEKLPVYSDEAMRKLTMPVFAVIAGRDVFFDSLHMKRRFEALVPDVEVDYRAEALHLIPDRTAALAGFLRRRGGDRGR